MCLLRRLYKSFPKEIPQFCILHSEFCIILRFIRGNPEAIHYF